MATRVQHKRSSVAANIPTAISLAIGELAINFADRYIYTKNGASAVIRLTGAFPLVQPLNQIAGDSYVDPTTGKLFAYFNFNGAGEAWNEIAPPEDVSGFVRHDGTVAMTGQLTVIGGASGNQAIGFAQADDMLTTALTAYLKKDGSVVMTGRLTLSADPISALHAATKQYVDTAVAIATPDLSAYLAKAGGVMVGQITLPGGGTGSQAATATEVAAAIASHVALTDPHTQYATVVEAQTGAISQATGIGGTFDAITLSFTPAITALVTNMRFRWRSPGANTITAPTINIESLGAKTIKKGAGSALLAGDTGAAGNICEAVYNGTDIILLNPPAIIPATDIPHTYTTTQTFNGPVVRGETTLTDASTIAWDLSTGGPNYKVTLGGNRTLGAYTGSTPGQEGYLKVIQDGTGGRTLSLVNAVYDFYGPSIENIALGAGEETVYQYRVISSGSMYLKRWGATSMREGDRDFLRELVASNSATIEFVLTKYLTLYDRFEIDFDQVIPATDNVQLMLRSSTNAGVSYDSGAGNYTWRQDRMHIKSATNSSDNPNSNSDSAIKIINNDGSLGMGTGLGLFPAVSSGNIKIYSPSHAAMLRVTWTEMHRDPDNELMGWIEARGAGVRLVDADVDAIQLLTSSGNITSGTFRLFGVRK